MLRFVRGSSDQTSFPVSFCFYRFVLVASSSLIVSFCCCVSFKIWVRCLVRFLIEFQSGWVVNFCCVFVYWPNFDLDFWLVSMLICESEFWFSDVEFSMVFSELRLLFVCIALFSSSLLMSHSSHSIELFVFLLVCLVFFRSCRVFVL